MKVLVTGHKGFIGQNLVKYIQANTDWQVNTWEWRDSVFPTVDGNDWVIHLGAISSTTEQNKDKLIEQNLEFSQRLHQACQRLYVNLQYSSSASVYGLESDFRESSPGRPANPYAWSKYTFDQWIKLQPANKIVQGFRYFNVYGNHEDHKGSQASPITQFTRQARETSNINLFHGSDHYLRDFIAVEDVCRIHVEFIKNVTKSGIWNLGTGKTRSFEDVAVLIRKQYSSTLTHINMPDVLKNSYQTYTCSDNTQLEAELGPQEWISIEEWLDKYKL
jgi:ADP-L-glycero-D-manno-heptose 6-epimerase